MAREAPRKISRSEKKQLAGLRKVKPDATETDLYNIGRSYINWAMQSERDREKTFWSGVDQARAIPMEAAAPIESRTSYAPGRALQGLIGRSNKAPTGYAMARSGAYGQPIPERTLRFGNNTFYPDYYRGEGEYSPAVIGQAIKDNPRLAAEATALGILSEFGRVTGTGEGMQEFIKDQGDGIIRRGTTMSMEDEFTKPASWVDYVSAGSWFVPGVGFTKPAMLAAKAGRAVGKAAMRSPKLAGAGVAGGAAAYGLSGGAEEAEAFKVRPLLALLDAGDEAGAKKFLNTKLNEALYTAIRKSDKTRKDIDPSWRGTTDRGKYKDLGKRNMMKTWNEFVKSNPDYLNAGDEVVFGHVMPRAKGGVESEDNFILMTRRTNDEMNNRGNQSLYEFVEGEMLRTGKSPRQVLSDWDLGHYKGPLPE